MAEPSFSAGERNKADPQPGARLGDYQLAQLLESGEAGQLFLARGAAGASLRLRVLTVPSDLDAEERMLYLGYVQKQANQVAALKHTHILPLLDYGIYQGRPYLVYPHYAIEALSKYLARKGAMEMLLAGRYLDQVAEALECAHQRGILHRNLNTDCIFVAQDGSLVVGDFGVLSMLEERGTARRGDQSQKDRRDPLFGMNEMSSPAPEQVSGNPVDTFTDVYALGAMLYRMLSGHRVFRGKTRAEIAQQHVSAPVPPVSKWRSDIPAAVDNVITKAMAKDPGQRFTRPGELANAYHQAVAPGDRERKPFVASSVPALAQVTSMKTEAIPGPPARMPRRRVLTLFVAGGGAAAAITIVSIFGMRALQSPTTPTTIANRPATPAQGANSGSSPVSGQGRVLARVSDLAPNSDISFSLASSNNPGLLIHLPDNRFVAFDSTCTHAGCAVDYIPQTKLLRCPCHDAIFDPARNAAVVSGPAPSPLTAIPISVNANGTITTEAQ